MAWAEATTKGKIKDRGFPPLCRTRATHAFRLLTGLVGDDEAAMKALTVVGIIDPKIESFPPFPLFKSLALRCLSSD